MNPCDVSVMSRSPRRRSTRTASRSTSATLAAGSVVVDRHQAALGLGHHLLGHHHHVAVGQRRRRRHGRRQGVGDHLGQVVARVRPRRSRRGPSVGGSPRWAPPGPPQTGAPRTVRASASARSGVDMTVGATTQRTPSASTAVGQVGVGLVDHQGAHPAGVEAGHPDHRGLVPELDQQPVGRTLQGGAGDDRRHGHHVGAPVGQGPGDARARPAPARWRRWGWRGRRRPSRRRAIASSTPGAGRAVPAPAKRTAAHRHRVAEPDEVVLEADLAARRRRGGSTRRVVGRRVTRVRTGSSDIGSSRTATPRAAASSAVTCSAWPPRPGAGCGRGGWPGRGRPGGTSVSPPRRLQLLHHRPGLAGQPPSRLRLSSPARV